MYIAQAFNILHDWWRYLIGLLIVIAGVFLGQVPFTIAVVFKTMSDGENLSEMDESTMLSILEPNWSLFLMLLSFAIGLVALFIAVKYIHKQTITHLTTIREKIDWKRFWFIFILWGVISTSFILLDYFMSPDDYVFNFKPIPFAILCVIAIIMVPLQTSFEEYLFRGYLMQGIGVSTIHKKFPFVLSYIIIAIILYIYLSNSFEFGFLLNLGYFGGATLILLLLTNLEAFNNLISSNTESTFYKLLKRNSTPLIITSLVFGLLHIANPEVEKLGYVIMVYYIGTGLFLGIMTLMDEGLELALGFHAANNLFTALLVTADWTAFQTHSIFKDMSDPSKAGIAEIFVPVFVVFPIILFILSRVYGWSNWSEKLFGKVVEPPKEDYKVLEDFASQIQ